MPRPIPPMVRRAAAGLNLRHRRRRFPGNTGGTYPNTGNHQTPGTTPPINPNSGGGIPPAAATPAPSAAYLARLRAAGLHIGPGGRIIGNGMGTDEQLRLAQRGYNKFGLGNTYFDPSRVGYHGGDTYSLGTGAGSQDAHNVVNDAVLARLRERAGWTPEAAAAEQLRNTPKWELTPGNPAGTLGATLSDPELYQRYLDAGRANAQQNAGGRVTNPNGQALLNAGTIRTDVPNAAPSYTNTPVGQQSGGQQTGGQQGTGQQGTQPAVASPQSAFDNGKDPTKHAAYWASVGWHQNPATGVWQGPNGAQWDQTPNENQGQGGNQGGGTSNPKPTDPNGPQNPVPTPTGQPASNTLPLDPIYEAQRQQAQAQFDRQMSAIQAAGLRLTNEEAVALARLATNEGVDVQQLLESMAGRGTLNSSLYGDARGLLATDQARTRQDLASSIADALSGLSVQAGDVQSDYESQLMEALLGSAGRAAADDNAAVDQYRTGNRNRRRRRRNRNRRARNA